VYFSLILLLVIGEQARLYYLNGWSEIWGPLHSADAQPPVEAGLHGIVAFPPDGAFYGTVARVLDAGERD
jgi:hypothetical protein